jgi:flavin-dependent dehydrogenase
VLERTPSPSHKVCGEFPSEETQGLLASLGLDLGALGAIPITRFRLVKGEREATSPLPFAAAGLSRHRLDHALLSLAERAGATVVRGTAVTGLGASVGGVSVRTERGSWQAAAVGLATGKHSVRGVARPPGTMVGFKLHLQATVAARHLAGIVQLVFFRGGYVGACLIEEGTLRSCHPLRAMAWRSPCTRASERRAPCSPEGRPMRTSATSSESCGLKSPSRA